MELLKQPNNVKFSNSKMQIVFNQKRELPADILNSILFFFNISMKDFSKLIEFTEGLKQHKNFITNHKKQFNTLTNKEIEIFKLVVYGKNSAEIADLLFIAVATVSTHRKNIKQKLHLKTTFDWYKYAKAFNLIQF